jgi:hypothetical protein
MSEEKENNNMKHWTENYPKLLRNSLDNLPHNKKPEKFNWDNYKNRKLDYDEIKIDIKHFTETKLKNTQLKDFIHKSVERLSGWLVKLSILSGKPVKLQDVVQMWSDDKRTMTYSYTITKEEIENAIKLYSEHKNSEIMLSEYFKLYNETVEKK